MRVLPGVLAFIAGCGFRPGAVDDQGVQDADTRPVDAPPMIDARPIDAAPAIDAPIDAPLPLDTDGDGIADISDNCPAVANTNQRDHDADVRGDACDRCPHLPSAMDPDGDGDGVGDACDPRPTAAGDSIALFEGFYDATAITGWTAVGNGMWSVANGVLTQSSTTTSTTNHALRPPLSLPRSRITSGVRVIALGTATHAFDTPHVSVATGIAQDQAYWCSVVDEGDDDKIYASVQRPNMLPSFPSASWPGTFAAMSELRLTSTLLGTNNPCLVEQGGTNVTVSGTIGSPSGGVQVSTRTAAASFDYVFVVSIGN